MKSLALPKIYLLLALLPVLTFVACGEDDDQTTPFDNTEFNGSYSFTYDGENFEYNGYGGITEVDTMITFENPDTGESYSFEYEIFAVAVAESTPEGVEPPRSRGLVIQFVNYSGTGEYDVTTEILSSLETGVYSISFIDFISEESERKNILTISDNINPDGNNYVNVTTDNNNRFEAEFRVVLETGEVMEGSMQFEK
ncbi:hypothetical protein [Phaeodactylibacter xiamenensis]|uniref:hypothetical protein n=1 Tax=Phaeodactylibacter xiamenensis TaxID=1524460 RepID=UPI0024A90A93|nr:hypothetical protein [Phaeodactylibacter xiamenensis]